MTHVDVLVVGAGPAGAAAARTLASAGHAVLLVDVMKEGGKIGESLPGAARPPLRDLGLLPWLARSEPRPSLGNLSSWGGDTVETTDFMGDPHGAGWHLDRNRFDACLRDVAAEAGARMLAARLRHLVRDADVWHAALGDGDVTARWLVDAGGRRSICAWRFGGGCLYDAPLIALYACGNSTDTDERTLLESVPCGWWYALPGSRRVAALHVTPADAAAILRDPPQLLPVSFFTRCLKSLKTRSDQRNLFLLNVKPRNEHAAIFATWLLASSTGSLSLRSRQAVRLALTRCPAR